MVNALPPKIRNTRGTSANKLPGGPVKRFGSRDAVPHGSPERPSPFSNVTIESLVPFGTPDREAEIAKLKAMVPIGCPERPARIVTKEMLAERLKTMTESLSGELSTYLQGVQSSETWLGHDSRVERGTNIDCRIRLLKFHLFPNPETGSIDVMVILKQTTLKLASGVAAPSSHAHLADICASINEDIAIDDARKARIKREALEQLASLICAKFPLLKGGEKKGHDTEYLTSISVYGSDRSIITHLTFKVG